MNVAELVKQPCAETVAGRGYELVNVTYEKEYGVWELTLFIKNRSGAPITHRDCERVSSAVDGLLETLDPTNGESYNLSVASVGIE